SFISWSFEPEQSSLQASMSKVEEEEPSVRVRRQRFLPSHLSDYGLTGFGKTDGMPLPTSQHAPLCPRSEEEEDEKEEGAECGRLASQEGELKLQNKSLRLQTKQDESSNLAQQQQQQKEVMAVEEYEAAPSEQDYSHSQERHARHSSSRRMDRPFRRALFCATRHSSNAMHLQVRMTAQQRRITQQSVVIHSRGVTSPSELRHSQHRTPSPVGGQEWTYRGTHAYYSRYGSP
ncbi:unnamed protein product, partial [Lota lota]